MKTSEMIKSKYWRAADVQGYAPFVFTIAAVTEEIVGRGPRPDTKYFLWLMEHNKGLQLNKTRVKLLEYAYGPDSDLWVGKRVRLSFDPTVEFAGKMIGGVRLETAPGTVYQAPAVALAPTTWPAGAPVPPQPVWNAQTQAWELPPMPIATPVAPASLAPAPLDRTMWGGAPTLSQRIAAAPVAGAEWVDTATGEVRKDEFNDPIPF